MVYKSDPKRPFITTIFVAYHDVTNIISPTSWCHYLRIINITWLSHLDIFCMHSISLFHDLFVRNKSSVEFAMFEFAIDCEHYSHTSNTLIFSQNYHVVAVERFRAKSRQIKFYVPAYTGRSTNLRSEMTLGEKMMTFDPTASGLD